MFEFLKKNKDGSLSDFFVDYIKNRKILTDLALEVGINRIADTIAKCGFQVIGTENASDIEYLLNVKPNVNQNAVDFWKQAVYRMIKNPEGCVIINLKNRGLFIADSWQTDNLVTSEKHYSNVKIIVDDDSLALNKQFKASDVIHLRYSNPRLIQLLNESNGNFEELLNVASSGFKANAPKVAVSIPGQLRIIDSETGKPTSSNEYAQQIAEKLSSGEIKSIVKHSGIEINAIDNKSHLSSNDIKMLREAIFENTATALGIPKSILFGDAGDNTDDFLTFACDPIIKIINNAINGAMVTAEEYSKKIRVLVNNLCVRHIDVINSAGHLDKLYQNGWSHNDILRLLGQPEIDEEWANKRRWTKNYTEEGEMNE